MSCWGFWGDKLATESYERATLSQGTALQADFEYRFSCDCPVIHNKTVHAAFPSRLIPFLQSQQFLPCSCF